MASNEPSPPSHEHSVRSSRSRLRPNLHWCILLAVSPLHLKLVCVVRKAAESSAEWPMGTVVEGQLDGRTRTHTHSFASVSFDGKGKQTVVD